MDNSDELECPICLEPFEHTAGAVDKRPVVLPCGHNICKHCFPQLHIKQCPECRFHLHDEPPLNYGLISLMHARGVVSPEVLVLRKNLDAAHKKNRELCQSLYEDQYNLQSLSNELAQIKKKMDSSNAEREKLMHKLQNEEANSRFVYNDLKYVQKELKSALDAKILETDRRIAAEREITQLKVHNRLLMAELQRRQTPDETTVDVYNSVAKLCKHDIARHIDIAPERIITTKVEYVIT